MLRTLRFFVASAVLFASSSALAADPADGPVPAPSPAGHVDPLFPHAGHFSGTVASGVPFVGVGEAAYGVTDRFAVGAMVGATPNMGPIEGTLGVGLRPRGVVFTSGAWRSSVVAPVLYYPKVTGFGGSMEPWMLVQPTLTLERSLGADTSLHAGAGLIAAACMESITTLGKDHDMAGGVWNTATFGGSTRLTDHTSVFAEAGLVLKGVVPAPDWIGGPAIAFVGVTREAVSDATARSSARRQARAPWPPRARRGGARWPRRRDGSGGRRGSSLSPRTARRQARAGRPEAADSRGRGT